LTALSSLAAIGASSGSEAHCFAFVAGKLRRAAGCRFRSLADCGACTPTSPPNAPVTRRSFWHSTRRREFRAHEDGGAALGVAFHEAPFAVHIFAGPGGKRGDGELVLLLALLDAGRAQMLQSNW
jgi:hypothetical protein